MGDGPTIDLDALAAGYRHRPASPAGITRAAAAAAHLAAGSWAIDVGGGPGAHAAVWALAGLRAIDVDLSREMLRIASAHDGILRVRADGASLPFADRSIGLVFFHLSIHHVDPGDALAEAARVLLPDGRCEIWTLGPRHHAASNLARWFPTVAAIDGRRFPDPEVLASQLAGLGMVDVARSSTVERVQRTAGSWLTSVRAGFVSTLQLVPEDEFERGVAAFAAAHPDPASPIEYDMYWDRVLATGRPLR